MQRKYTIHITTPEKNHQSFCKIPTESEKQAQVCSKAEPVEEPSPTTSAYLSGDEDLQAFIQQFERQENNVNQWGGARFDIHDPVMQRFNFTMYESKTFKGAIGKSVTYKANLLNTRTGGTLEDAMVLEDITDMLTELFKRAKSDTQAKGSDMMSFSMDHPDLNNPIVIRPRKFDDIDLDEIVNYIEYVAESAKGVSANEDLDLRIGVIKMPEGGKGIGVNVFAHDAPRAKSLIKIKNRDELCLARAVAVGEAQIRFLTALEKDKLVLKKHYRNMKTDPKQARRALLLAQLSGIDLKNPAKIEDIEKLEKVVKINIKLVAAISGNSVVYSGCAQFNHTMYLYYTERSDANGVVKGHYDYINRNRMAAMMAQSYYCYTCDKAYNNRSSHACANHCKVCGRDGCKILGEDMTCRNCGLTCRSMTCFKKHKSKRGKAGSLPSVCETFWKCKTCKKTFDRKERKPTDHDCAEFKCSNCNQFVIGVHLCYMRAAHLRKGPRSQIYFDCETRSENGVHVPNFILAQTACDECQGEDCDSDSVCAYCGHRCHICYRLNKEQEGYAIPPCADTCGKREVQFVGENATENFCTWLFHKQHKDSVVVAHNGKAFDNYFMYKFALENALKPDVIFTGSKIMSMSVKKGLNIRFIDSFNFLPMALARMPKALGLTCEDKGTYPYLFNTQANESYEGTMPAKTFFAIDRMNPGKRIEFEKWYAENSHLVWNWKNETEKYCRQDVVILRKAMTKFREMMIDLTKSDLAEGVDPLNHVTIASTCMTVFRSKFLEEDVILKIQTPNNKFVMMEGKFKAGAYTVRNNEGNWVPVEQIGFPKEKIFLKSKIGIVPPNNYSGTACRYSVEALKWLAVVEKTIHQKTGIPLVIQSALTSGGEKNVRWGGNSYSLDGYCHFQGQRLALEYNECIFHGCPTCFPGDRLNIKNPVNGKSMEELFAITLKKKENLEKAGYKVISKWSHEFAHDLETDSRMLDFVQSLDFVDIINIRDALYGGRTSAICLHATCPEGYEIKYNDITSMYPFQNKVNKYPTDHPVHIHKNFKPIGYRNCSGECEEPKCTGKHTVFPYFGFVKLKILPPTDLMHPLLPYRVQQKLKFPLCADCAEREPESHCQCPDEKRAFVATYCTPEVERALDYGYKIIKIYHVLHYETSETYGTEGNKGLFGEYIDTFLKIKQEASGYPPGVTSEDAQKKYVKEYFETEGIRLDPSNIQVNKGLRQVAKLMLNSFWGKTGQRDDMSSTTVVCDPVQLYKLVRDPSVNILDWHIFSDECMVIVHDNATGFKKHQWSVNPMIAAFTTCYARLQLYGVISRIENTACIERRRSLDSVLKHRVLYFDTDSVIFSYKKGSSEFCPIINSNLGGMTDELSCNEVGCSKANVCSGHYIKEMTNLGPKNYGYKLNTSEVFVKARGFTLDHRASLILTFEVMKQKLMAWINNEKSDDVIIQKDSILRDKWKVLVFNKLVSKRYSMVFNKRKALKNLTSVPWGYKI